MYYGSYVFLKDSNEFAHWCSLEDNSSADALEIEEPSSFPACYHWNFAGGKANWQPCPVTELTSAIAEEIKRQTDYLNEIIQVITDSACEPADAGVTVLVGATK